MITSRTGNNVGKTGTTQEIKKSEVCQELKTESKDITENYISKTVSCPICGTTFKPKNVIELFKIQKYLEKNSCGFCSDSDNLNKVFETAFEIDNEEIYCLKLGNSKALSYPKAGIETEETEETYTYTVIGKTLSGNENRAKQLILEIAKSKKIQHCFKKFVMPAHNTFRATKGGNVRLGSKVSMGGYLFIDMIVNGETLAILTEARVKVLQK